MESRILKFRVFDPIRKEMKDDTSAKDILYNRSRSTVGYFDECPIMQFTGLTDKNGKEIYEGDIMQRVAVEGRQDELKTTCKVKFEDGSFWRELITDSRPFYYEVTLSSAHFHDEQWEIIGNIYETPQTA